MFKKSWIPLVFCLGFIVFWEAFVIRPYEQKVRLSHQLKNEENKKEINRLATKGSLPSSTNVGTSTGSIQALSADERTLFDHFSLNAQRSVDVFSKGALGAAEFRDYKIREKKESLPVVLLPQPLRWESTDSKVAECLKAFSAQKAGEGMVFKATTSSGSCSLEYKKDPSHDGVVQAAMTLSGFAGSQGFLEFKGSDSIGDGPALDQNNLVYRVDASKDLIRDKKLYESRHVEGKVDWLLWGDRYFASVLLPKGNFNPNIIAGAADQAKKQIYFGFQYPILLKANEPTHYEMNVYFGTRDPESLAQVEPTLSTAVDLGMFSGVARIMLWALKHLNTVFGNFGVSIIVLTLLVRLAFLPLNRKAYMSTIKMKALQPQIDKIKAKYGSDKSKAQQMNLELMALYKTNKVNPVGSCLPLLLQMPIFFGLYGALNHALDLYQAPFFGWITDLSSKDPYYVLPALWTITLVGYTRLNPQTSNSQPGMPDMKWMMLGMNVFFGFLSKSWPAGLTLYLFVSNLVGITQQLMMQRATKLQPVQEGV